MGTWRGFYMMALHIGQDPAATWEEPPLMGVVVVTFSPCKSGAPPLEILGHGIIQHRC